LDTVKLSHHTRSDQEKAMYAECRADANQLFPTRFATNMNCVVKVVDGGVNVAIDDDMSPFVAVDKSFHAIQPMDKVVEILDNVVDNLNDVVESADEALSSIEEDAIDGFSDSDSEEPYFFPYHNHPMKSMDDNASDSGISTDGETTSCSDLEELDQISLGEPVPLPSAEFQLQDDFQFQTEEFQLKKECVDVGVNTEEVTVSASTEEEKQYVWEGDIFYKKPLPDCNIGYSSVQGRKIFKRAFKTKYMNMHLPLMEQFRTQNEPMLCAFGSLTTVLNTLQVDPGRVWQIMWRWYDEYMIKGCVKVEEQRRDGSGVDFDQLCCTARMNHLDVDAVRVSEGSSIKHFRKAVKEVCQSADSVMICSYFRETLGQTGTGHFVPIGGYDKKEDLVLVLDVARFKLPPHWVPLELMWEAMKPIDDVTGLPRGYFVAKKNMENPEIRLLHHGEVLLTIDPQENETPNTPPSMSPPSYTVMQDLFAVWDTLLESGAKDIEGLVDSLLSSLTADPLSLEKFTLFNIMKTLNADDIKSINESQVYNLILKHLQTLDTSSLPHIIEDKLKTPKHFSFSKHLPKQLLKKLKGKSSSLNKGSDFLASFLSILVLFYPYKLDQRWKECRTIFESIEKDLSILDKVFTLTMQEQLLFMRNILQHTHHEVDRPDSEHC